MPGERLVTRSDRRFVGVESTLSVKLSWPIRKGVIVQSPAVAASSGSPLAINSQMRTAPRDLQKGVTFVRARLLSGLRSEVAVGAKGMRHPGGYLVEQQRYVGAHL